MIIEISRKGVLSAFHFPPYVLKFIEEEEDNTGYFDKTIEIIKGISKDNITVVDDNIIEITDSFLFTVVHKWLSVHRLSTKDNIVFTGINENCLLTPKSKYDVLDDITLNDLKGDCGIGFICFKLNINSIIVDYVTKKLSELTNDDILINSIYDFNTSTDGVDTFKCIY